MRSLLLLVILAFVGYLAAQGTCPRCIPLCQNGDGSLKSCGSDGCGGSCGTCPQGQSCCSGTCACVPNCAGRTCGDDGCGYNSCGRCSSTTTCVNGACVGQAVPECQGRVCGSDGAGGICGTCPSGQRCRAGLCECYYDCQERNCGSAVQPVGTSTALCPARSCGTCPTGFSCGTGGLCSAVDPCTVNFEIRECSSNAAVTTTCTAAWSFGSVGGTQTTPPSTWTWTVPANGYGSYSASINCDGYAAKNQNFVLGTSTTLVTFCVDRPVVPVRVVECGSNAPLSGTTSVAVTSTTSASYSASLTVSGGSSASWTVPGYGSYTFTSTHEGYSAATQTINVSSATSEIVLCLDKSQVLVDVRDRTTNLTITVSAAITYTGVASGSISWNGVTSWTHQGYGNYNFVAVPSAFYSQGTLSIAINAQTSTVIIYVDPLLVQIDVRAQDTNLTVTFPVTLTYSGAASGTIAWNGITSWRPTAYGAYSFIASHSNSLYLEGSLSTQVSQSTTIIVIYLPVGIFCGDGTCNGNEDYDFCPQDCLSLVLEMENAEGTGPVTEASINYYSANPRTPDEATGPNRNSVPVDKTRVAVPGSNVIAELTYSKGIMVYFEAFRAVGDYINFFWVADTTDTRAVSEDGIYKLRVHLSRLLQSNNKNYRFVNTWKPIDAPPLPYGPTDLNLHLFHPAGALDINTKTLTQNGFEIGNAVADSKQSGGPATMDISPGAEQMVAVWNSKPPRSSAITSSQNGRSLIHSGSYVVVYGKTANAAQGKQLGQFVLNQYLSQSAAAAADTTSDLWYIGQMTVKQSGVNQPDMLAQNKLKKATIDSTRAMIFDCEAYAYCAQYVVPYSDSGRRDVQEEF